MTTFNRSILGAALIEALQTDCGYATATIVADGLTAAFASATDARAVAETVAIELLPFIRPDLLKLEG